MSPILMTLEGLFVHLMHCDHWHCAVAIPKSLRLLALMEFHMVPTGVPVRLGSQFLFNAYKNLLEGGSVPEHFAERRTVFIHKTSDIDDNGRIIRSPDALRPIEAVQLRSQTSYFCHLSRPPLVHHEMRTSFAEIISSRHNIFEIETTVLAHVACSPQESGILLWRTFLLPFPASIIPGSSLWLRTLNCLTFSADSCEVFPTTAPRMWTEHPHTSHFLVFHSTHTPMSHASCAVVVLILLDSPFCTLHRLSHLPSHSPDLHLPCRLVRVEQIPCAPPRMRR